MRLPFSTRFITKAAAVWLVLLPGTLLAAPAIVVSIKPVELLVRAVATEDTSVTTLVPPAANPHNFSMKPSQRRALEQADAVFWVGPDLETFLTGLLTGPEFRSRSHALNGGEAPEMADSDDHHHGHDHHTGHDHHDHGADADPHIWLDPALSLGMAREIHQALASMPGADTATLDANLAAFEQSLTEAETDIRQRLEPAREVSLFTYHNAFSHFAEHYNLNLTGVLNLNPDVSPGARHIADVQTRLRNAKRPCLMTEQPFNPQSWESITGDVDVTFSAWDPLAAAIEPGPDAYVAFQRSLADAVLKCL